MVKQKSHVVPVEEKGLWFECGDDNWFIIIFFYFYIFFAFHSALFKESENELQVDSCKINPHCNVVWKRLRFSCLMNLAGRHPI